MIAVAVLVVLVAILAVAGLILFQIVKLEHRLLNGDGGLLHALETEARTIRHAIRDVNGTLARTADLLELEARIKLARRDADDIGRAT